MTKTTKIELSEGDEEQAKMIMDKFERLHFL